ncbi:MAG: glycosyltransferase family 39 protein [Bacteroidales bacterium]|nr:glycosyltransferase family 39 protein [Bacteroidales bacterium]
MKSLLQNIKPAYIAGLLFLFNLFVKVLFIGSNQIDIDEPFSIYWAQAELNELLGLFKDENNPPAFFILLHFWIKIFGTSIWSVRFLPSLFASLAVLFIFRTGTRFFNNFVAITASLLYTFSNIATYHSHDVRVYSMFIFLSSVSVYYLLRLYNQPTDKKALAWWVVVNILLAYSHFYAFLLLFFEFAFILCNRQFRQKLLKPLFVLLGAIFLAYLPYAKLIILRFMSAKGGTWVEKPDFQAPYSRFVEFSNQPLTAVFFLLVIGFTLFLFVKRKTKISSPEWLIFLWFIASFLFMFLISFKVPMFIPKYMVYILPGFYLSLSLLMSRISVWNKRTGLVVAGLAVLLMAATSNLAEGNNRQPKETADYVRGIMAENSVAILCPPWLDLNFSYYYDMEMFNDFGNVRQRLNGNNIYPVYDFKGIKPETLNRAERVLFIDGWAQVSDPEGTILSNLRRMFGKEEVVEFKGYKVFSFSQRRI